MSLRFRSVLSAPFGYSASCSSFQPSIGSASQGLSQRPPTSFRPLAIFPVPYGWFPVRLSRFRLFSFSVCSLSLFPDSLPQPFLRCSGTLRLLQLPLPVRPCSRSLRFRPGLPVLPLRSRPFRTPLLSLCFFLSPLQVSASQWLPPCPPRFCFLSSASYALVSRLRFSPPVRFRFPRFVSSASVPFGSVRQGRLRLRYSVPLLFLSPHRDLASQRLPRVLAFPLGFRPSP